VRYHTATSPKNQRGALSSRLLAVVVAALGLVLILGAGTASAVVIRSQVEAFGPDGTAESSFSHSLRDLAFNQSARGIYATDGGAPGIYGFDVSALPVHSPLAGFSPLITAATGDDPGVAVDNTALSSAGNVYLVSESTGLVYGFDKTGVPLGGNFPINPAISPGAPSGSPKDICGAGVDAAGNVWVANFSTRSILEYSATGVYQTSVSTTGQDFRPCSIAFDSNGDMYATDGNSPSGATYIYTAASGYTSATLITSSSGRGNAVDGSTHHVFTINHTDAVGEYDSAGNLISTISEKDSTGDVIIPTASGIKGATFVGVAVDSVNNHVYVADGSQGKIRVFGAPLVYADPVLGAASGVENTTANVAGTVSAQGVALSDCHFEFVSEAAFGLSGFSDLSSGGSASCSPAFDSIPVDSASHPVSATLGGLTANTAYRFRLVAANGNGSIATPNGGFVTAGPALVETTGSPVRTATTARLDSRVSPMGAEATYHFEYGDQGPCDSSPCASTETRSVGSSSEFELVSQQLSGLEPDTTYHYRVVADNGNPVGPVPGEDMTLTTFADDALLSHGHFPGPEGSDRAWELVSAPDSGGNPVGNVGSSGGASSISDTGDRAVYAVSGGTPLSEVGTLGNRLFAERTSTGWQTKKIYATREEAKGSQWFTPGGPSDLSAMITENEPGVGDSGEFSVWRLTPNDPATEIFHAPHTTVRGGGGNGTLIVSDDGSRVLITLVGAQDPTHPAAPGTTDLYDVGTGSPQLISLLPNGTVPACGIREATSGGAGIPSNEPLLSRGNLNRSEHWVSADGSLAFFPTEPCEGTPERLFVRDIEAETTKLISGPPVSGAECAASFIKSVPGAAFFYTQSRLTGEDTEPEGCSTENDGDVYRYDLGDGSLDCVTCVVPGLDAAVVSDRSNPFLNGSRIGVAEDGSRVYFTSQHPLLPGASPKDSTYRVDVASGDLAYVGAFGEIGDYGRSTMSADGSVVVFESDSSSLNAFGGQQNGGTKQDYRYDDRDRSLICVSCPADGSVPRGEAFSVIKQPSAGANMDLLDADGGIFAFATPTALLPADQNTAGAGQGPAVGTDIYEWREGRLLLVTDGLTNWPAERPGVTGITPSGHDIFFTVAAQYTHDALDGYKRLYDARIGGGFDFPPPRKPCPLEVCQGTPKGAPEEAPPGTASITGVGNVTRAGRVVCAKPKRKVRRGGRTRCASPKPSRKKNGRQRANHDRRTAR
jgi:hypothetical protein